jgi:DNA-binding IclR family transcriptional regulator
MNREELSEETDIPLPTLRVTLQRLEARNKIRNSGGQYYINENDI